jgi:hypothetical protein
MHKSITTAPWGRQFWCYFTLMLIFIILISPSGASIQSTPGALAQADPRVEDQIEQSWHPDYLKLATGDPTLKTLHGVYDWPFDLDSIGWSMQSYQDYGGTPYFHHGMDMMKINGTNVYNRSGGQVVNIENYQPGWDLYWEVAVLDLDGYIWQYHHIEESTIPQLIWDKFSEWQNDHENGGFIPPDTYIGDIIYWPVWSFGKQFNHIHLNILAEGGVYVNGFEFHSPLPDTVGPVIQDIGLLQNGQVLPGDQVEGAYSLYVRARDLILDDVYYLPPWDIKFSVDNGPEQTTWQFNTLPGGADDTAYLDDFYVVPPTCGDYDCRDYYIDLGFVPDAQYAFPWTGGQHTIQVTVSDYAGNTATQSYTYMVIGPPPGTPIWEDDFESDQDWITNPDGTDTAISGQWESGNPEATYLNGPKQLGDTTSGVNDLVTGRLAGANANSFDVDGGLTSIRSPAISLPPDGELFLSLRYYFSHANNASIADYLQVKVIGTQSELILVEVGSANDDDASWAIDNVSLNSFAGDTVYILIEAADETPDSLIEAAIDDVVIYSTQTNHAPLADPQSISTEEDTPIAVTLTGSDVDDDLLTYSVLTNPGHGSLSGTPPEMIYTPGQDYFGTDVFLFQVNDGLVSSEPAEVSIEVTPTSDPPVAIPQAIIISEDTPADILLVGYDPDGDPISFEILTTPTQGILGGTAPNLVYTPTLNFNGDDIFSFTVSDESQTSQPADVNIQVTPINDAPIAYTQLIVSGENRSVAITLSASDVEGDLLTYFVQVPPVHGSLSGTAPYLVYSPYPGYLGTDSFSFVANDGEVDSDPALISIEITANMIFMPVLLR